jgi:Ca2+:H+ antiporter
MPSASQFKPYVFPAAALLLAVATRVLVDHLLADSVWVEIVIPVFSIILLFPTVIVALHHSEAAAARLGEPYGTLLLTATVTIIEVSVIVSVMLEGAGSATLARESVFSVVMIVTTGGVGLCLTLGALRYGEQNHQTQGTSAYLAVMMALSALLLILPNFTITTGVGTFSAVQLAYISGLSVLLYGAFLYIQTVRHQAYFIDGAEVSHRRRENHEAVAPLGRSVVCLLAGLVAVVLLSERVAAGAEDGLATLGVRRPEAIIGALLAALLLAPELAVAVRAAWGNQLQRSINVLLGSALATIGLTIPAVAVVSLLTGNELVLGLESRDEVLLILAMMLSVVSFGTGRTNVLTGIVHLVVFLAYLLLLFIP